MANAIYEWAGTIVSYMVFVTVLGGLLPAVRYVKYLRLFSGCVLILLVFRPLTEGLRLEESIDHFFHSISFENEINDLTDLLDGELDDMEEKRLDIMISAYEQEVGQEIIRLAEADGFAAEAATVRVERNPEESGFGKVNSIVLNLSETVGQETDTAVRQKSAETGAGNTGGKSVTAGVQGAVVKDVEVEPVIVEPSAAENIEVEASAGENRAEKDAAAEKMTAEDAADKENAIAAAALLRLKQQIAAYYQVEEAYVEIRVED